MTPLEEKQFWTHGTNVTRAAQVHPSPGFKFVPVTKPGTALTPTPAPSTTLNIPVNDPWWTKDSYLNKIGDEAGRYNYKMSELSTYPKVESDPSGGSLNEPGKKADAGKNLPWLFQTGFANALYEVSRVTTLGARKYTPGGWATVPNGIERYMEGFARHTSSLARGEQFDNGPTGLGADIYHKASMIWNLLASLELEIRESKK